MNRVELEYAGSRGKTQVIWIELLACSGMFLLLSICIQMKKMKFRGL